MPKISVIVPVYNGAMYIEKCIDSLRVQTLRDIEIIIVNDGSTDGTLEIIKRKADLDNRIIVIDKKNEGVCVARNIGIENAKSKWIAFSDADDYYLPNGLQILLSVADSLKTRVIIGNANIVSQNGIIQTRHSYNSTRIIKEYPRCSFQMWGNLYSKDLLKEFDPCFEPGLAYFEDRLLQSKLIANEGHVGICESSVYIHIANDSSVLASKDGLRKATHILHAARLLYDYSKITPSFKPDIIASYLMVRKRAFAHFVLNQNATIGELKRIYCNEFGDFNGFYHELVIAYVNLYKYKFKKLVSK